MFTGLIEKQATVIANTHSQQNAGNCLLLNADYAQAQPGESIAINGVCLTLASNLAQQLSFDLSPETLSVTALANLQAGDVVNLERAMLASSRFGGHYMHGHVDTIATIKQITTLGEFVEIKVGDFALTDLRYLIPKGSIALDGISLTINKVEQNHITIMLIPHTLAHTSFSKLKLQQKLNVEFDYLIRIVAHQVTMMQSNSIQAAV